MSTKIAMKATRRQAVMFRKPLSIAAARGSYNLG
jgi:hypothetical protein